MKQTVTLTRLANRHSGPDREFAISWEIEVEAGSLSNILLETAAKMEQEPEVAFRRRWTISISEPYD